MKVFIEMKHKFYIDLIQTTNGIAVEIMRIDNTGCIESIKRYTALSESTVKRFFNLMMFMNKVGY